jgi:hypothetical protein
MHYREAEYWRMMKSSKWRMSADSVISRLARQTLDAYAGNVVSLARTT